MSLKHMACDYRNSSRISNGSDDRRLGTSGAPCKVAARRTLVHGGHSWRRFELLPTFAHRRCALRANALAAQLFGKLSAKLTSSSSSSHTNTYFHNTTKDK